MEEPCSLVFHIQPRQDMKIFLRKKPTLSASPRRLRLLIIFAITGAFILYRFHVASSRKNDDIFLNVVEILEPDVLDMSRIEHILRAQGDNDDIEPEYERFLNELELRNTNPGENGEALLLPHRFSREVRRKVKDGFEKHGFNAFASNLISVKRSLTDPRSEECKARVYSNLTKCSIVITFHNEEWSLLLRTLNSVISRSPDDLIEEILLLDDASDRGKY